MKTKAILIIGLICLLPLLAGCSKTEKPLTTEPKVEIIKMAGASAGYSKEDQSSYRMEMEQISIQLDKIRKNTLTGCREAESFYFWVDENFDLLKSNEAKWEKIRAEMTKLKGVCDNDYLKYGGK